jgi:hypothetical protein
MKSFDDLRLGVERPYIWKDRPDSIIAGRVVQKLGCVCGERPGECQQSLVLSVLNRYAFPGGRGEAHQREISQLKLRDQLVKIFRKRVVVVASGWLARLAEDSAVVGDDPVTRI